MTKFTVAIEETVVQEFEIEAESQTDALNRAKELYSAGELVVGPGEVQSKQMAVLSSTPVVWDPF